MTGWTPIFWLPELRKAWLMSKRKCLRSILNFGKVQGTSELRSHEYLHKAKFRDVDRWIAISQTQCYNWDAEFPNDGKKVIEFTNLIA